MCARESVNPSGLPQVQPIIRFAAEIVTLVSGFAWVSWWAPTLSERAVCPIVRGDYLGRIRPFRTMIASQVFLLHTIPIHFSAHIRLQIAVDRTVRIAAQMKGLTDSLVLSRPDATLSVIASTARGVAAGV